MGSKRNFLLILIGIIIVSWFIGVLVYQSPVKTEKVYKEAINDLKNEKYANAYYLFSKVSFFFFFFSIELYHQAECAEKIQDTDISIKKY